MDDSRERLRILFERLSSGDLEQLESLYDLLAPKIYGLALWRTGSSSDASDVVQEVFVKLAARARQLGSVRHPLQYVLRMAHHSSIDTLRERKGELPIEDALVIPDSNRSPDHAARFSSLIRELPPEQREAIYLRYFVGLSLSEISDATGVSLFTAASRCRLAISKLKRRFGAIK